jgi:hypothetical protein
MQALTNSGCVSSTFRAHLEHVSGTSAEKQVVLKREQLRIRYSTTTDTLRVVGSCLAV